MKVETLKVILEVLLQKLNNKSDNINDYLPKNSFKLSEELFDGIIPDLLRNVVETIKKQAAEESTKGDCVKKITYEALLVIFLHTTQQERFLYFKELLEHFYNQLVQKLIQLKKNETIPVIEDFNEIVSKLLPFVKLQVVKDISERVKNGDDKLKIGLMELYETVLYPSISREDCYEIIRNKLGEFDAVHFTDFEIRPVDEKNGFLGEYFKLKIYISYQQKPEVHNFFLKSIPTKSDEIRTNMALVSFRKEEGFYMKIIPYLKKLGFKKIIDFLPDCYLSRKNRFMVFEDACANNYSNLDIRVPFTYDQLSLIYKQLAKFHACGLLFEEKLSAILKTKFRLNLYYEEMLTESFAIKNNEHTAKLFDTSIITNNYAIEKLSRIIKNGNMEKFKDKCSDAVLKYFDLAESTENRRNFLTHGDLWCNNFFFDKDQTSCLLLDFQIIRYNLPGFDLYFLLATNTDLKTRLKYGEKLLGEYYDNLKYYLLQYDVNIENILTYNQFLKNVEDVKPTCLAVALIYLLIMLLPKDKMVRIFEDSELSQTFFTGDRSKIMNELWDDLKYKSRYEDLIQELYLVFNK